MDGAPSGGSPPPASAPSSTSNDASGSGSPSPPASEAAQPGSASRQGFSTRLSTGAKAGIAVGAVLGEPSSMSCHFPLDTSIILFPAPCAVLDAWRLWAAPKSAY